MSDAVTPDREWGGARQAWILLTRDTTGGGSTLIEAPEGSGLTRQACGSPIRASLLRRGPTRALLAVGMVAGLVMPSPLSSSNQQAYPRHPTLVKRQPCASLRAVVSRRCWVTCTYGERATRLKRAERTGSSRISLLGQRCGGLNGLRFDVESGRAGGSLDQNTQSRFDLSQLAVDGRCQCLIIYDPPVSSHLLGHH